VRRWLDLGAWQELIFRNSKSSFAGDVIKLVGGTAFAQALSILASPIIARMYGPDAYGLSALFTSIAGIIAIVACLRYEMAIMLPEKDEDSANLLALSLFLAATVSGSTALVFWLDGEELLSLLNARELEPFLWLVPISVFLSGVFLALNYWNSRSKRFGKLSTARVSASVVTTGTQLGAGFAGYPTGGSLIEANILGSVASTLMLLGQIWSEDKRILKQTIKWNQLIDNLRRYKRFPVYDIWSALLNSISWQLPTFILSSFFSSRVVGYYALGMMVLQLPTNLIGSAISQVFFQRAVEAKSKGNLAELAENTVIRLIMIGIFPFLTISLIGKDAFVVVFGSAWAEAGIYVQILALWMFFQFIASPISTIFSILEMQRASLIMNIMALLIRGCALIAGGIIGDARIAVLLFSATGLVIYVLTNVWLINKAGGSIARIMQLSRISFAYCIPFLVVILLGKWFLSPNLVVITSCIVSLLYFTAIIRTRKLAI
jgi:lipopolysaccharide exporter